MTRTWVEVCAVETRLVIQQRETTSTMANTQRRACPKRVTSQIQILFGSVDQPVGPRRAGPPWCRRLFGQHKRVGSQNAP